MSRRRKHRAVAAGLLPSWIRRRARRARPTSLDGSHAPTWIEPLEPRVMLSTAVLAVAGDAAPDGNGVFTINGFLNFPPAINDAGDVLFQGDFVATAGGFNDNTGIYVGNADGLTQIARKGDAAPNGNGSFNVFVGTPTFNDAGQVAFNALLPDATLGSVGLFRSDGETLTTIVRVNDAVSDNSDDGIFSAGFGNPFGGTPAIDAAGNVAFLTGLRDTADEAVFGIFIGDGVTRVQVQRQLTSVSGDDVIIGVMTEPIINEAGRVTYTATLAGAGTAGGATSAVFVDDTPIAIAGSATPDGLATFTNIGLFDFSDINAAGDVAFSAQKRTFLGATEFATYFGNDDGLTEVTSRALIGANDLGQFAYLNEVPGFNTQALYVTDDSGTRELVRDGDSPPDGDGVIIQIGGFGGEHAYAINDRGDVAFLATLQGSNNNRGIFVVDNSGHMRQAVRVGDSLLGSTITTLNFRGQGANDDASGLNDDGQVAYYFVLADGRNGVAMWTDETLDFGDAPDSYGSTLAADGARHTAGSLTLGDDVDVEADGQSSADATGDNNDQRDDEAGVTFDSILSLGETSQITVNVSEAGLLDAWIDFDGDGVFDAGDRIFSSESVQAGDNVLDIDVPISAAVGSTFARFRVSSVGGLGPTGEAGDGEVEDYHVTIDQPTTTVSIEATDAAASEDGDTGTFTVIRTDSTLDELVVSFDVTGSAGAGDYDAIGDTVTIPAGSSSATITITPADDQEVEGDEDVIITLAAGVDYEVGAGGTGGTGGSNAATVTISDNDVDDLDFSDAPATYGVALADNGPRHVVGDGLFLGAGVDFELDGSPSANAAGDDDAGTDDEDGVTFQGELKPGESSDVEVIASQAGLLDAWIDFNGDGVFGGSEQIFTSHAVAAGSNALTFSLPINAAAGSTFARFRISTAGGLSPLGVAVDGEVEDHAATITPLNPEIGVEVAGDVITSGQGAAVMFDDSEQGQADRPTLTFAVRNAGDDPLNIANVTLPSGFLFGSDAVESVVAVGGSATFSVVVNTSDDGEFAGDVVITSNDQDEFTFAIPIMATVLPVSTEAGFSEGFDAEASLESYRRRGSVQLRNAGGTAGNVVVLNEQEGDASISRRMRLSQRAEAVTFDYRFLDRGENDRLRVRINEGEAEYEIANTDVSDSFASSGELNLTAFAGQTVTVELLLESADGAEAELEVDNIAIVNDDTVVLHADSKGRIVYEDASGDQVAIVIKKGTGHVVLPASGIGDAMELVVTDATSKTAVTVSVKGSDGDTVIDQVTIDGDLKQFTGKTLDVAGGFESTGAIGKLTLRDVLAGATVFDLGGNAGDKATNITLGRVTGLDLQVGTPIKQIKVIDWQRDGAMVVDHLVALEISKLTVAGDKKDAAVPGDFEADITAATIGKATITGDLRDAALTLTGSDGVSMKKFTVKQSTTNTQIVAGADVVNFTTGLFVDSRLAAGVNPASPNLPESQSDFNAAATIKKFVAKGLKNDPRAAFAGSVLAASTVSLVSLKLVDSDNAGVPFGMAFVETKSISFTDEAGKQKIKKPGDLDDLTLGGDLTIRIVD